MKQVLITGGATGIGAATAQVFLERGYRVFVTVHQTAAELPGVTAIPCDITDPADVERLFAAVGTVDVLVNNAGISLIRQIQDTTPEDYDALMGVNCKGVFLCSRAAAVDMLRRHSGAIVNVSSMWGQVGASCETVYSMSKAGVIGFTRALAQEPKLLVFDEPTGNLDVANEQRILRQARRLARTRGMTVLCTLHDLNQAMAYGDRLFLMRDGQVRYAGNGDILTPETVWDIFGARVRAAEIDGQKILIGVNEDEY